MSICVLEEFVKLRDSRGQEDIRTGDGANGICPYLQMEADFPSNHTSGWMPILNLAVKVAEDKSINFKWFKKSMASPFTILNAMHSG